MRSFPRGCTRRAPRNGRCCVSAREGRSWRTSKGVGGRVHWEGLHKNADGCTQRSRKERIEVGGGHSKNEAVRSAQDSLRGRQQNHGARDR